MFKLYHFIKFIIEVKNNAIFNWRAPYAFLPKFKYLPIQLGTYQAALQCISHLQQGCTCPYYGAKSTKHESHFVPASHIEIPLGSTPFEEGLNSTNQCLGILYGFTITTKFFFPRPWILRIYKFVWVFAFVFYAVIDYH